MTGDTKSIMGNGKRPCSSPLLVPPPHFALSLCLMHSSKGGNAFPACSFSIEYGTWRLAVKPGHCEKSGADCPCPMALQLSPGDCISGY